MPKPLKNVLTIKRCLRIKLRDILKPEYLNGDFKGKGTIVWGNKEVGKDSLTVIIVFNDIEKYMRLIYTIPGTDSREQIDVDQKINFCRISSNLGQGYIYFFKCIFGYQRCRTLYFSSDSPYFMCRLAHKRRIYYEYQRSSKKWYSNDRYWDLKPVIEDKERKIRRIYNGQKTKSLIRFEKLKDKFTVFEQKRLNELKKDVMRINKNIKFPSR